MGKTHEALERAEKDYLEMTRTTPEATLIRPKDALPWAVSSRNGKEYYQSLKVNLRTLYADKEIRTILFCATAHGDGSTTTASNFAGTLANDRQAKVLLVDANLRTPRLHDMCQVDHTPGLSDYVEKEDEPVLPIPWKGSTSLSVLPCGSLHSGPVSLFESGRFDKFLEEMREQFDYVILDGAPLPKFPELRVICSKVDGVVLVVKAGDTRRQVALRAKKELEEAGAKILGVVINKRKYYIPEWIYKRL